MSNLHYDSNFSDAERRQQIYRGDLFVFSPRESTRALCDFGRELCEEAFAPHDPRMAQHRMPVEDFVAILAELKPRFIHHPRCKELIRNLFEDLGCDPEETYFDVPRLRTMAGGDYLRAGLALPFHPHRDTWYSAPLAQINWWLPVYDVGPDNTVFFYTDYFHRALENTSSGYNYYEWNAKSRVDAAKYIEKDTRVQPASQQPIEPGSELRVAMRRGCLLLFSGAQLHGTVDNASGDTRFSIDFRVVNRPDLSDRASAPNVDSAPEGTTLRDFMRATDHAKLPDEIVDIYDDVSTHRGVLVYEPEASQ
jgi:hypothetical protein